MSGKYGEPWHGDDFYQDGYHEVGDSNALLVCRSGNQHEYARSQRDRLVACVNALADIPDEALEAGVVGKVRGALKAFVDSRIKEEARGNVYALGELHAAYDLCAAALSLLQESPTDE